MGLRNLIDGERVGVGVLLSLYTLSLWAASEDGNMRTLGAAATYALAAMYVAGSSYIEDKKRKMIEEKRSSLDGLVEKDRELNDFPKNRGK